MKKMMMALAGAALLCASCASGPVLREAYNPEDLPEAQLATVRIGGTVTVNKIDDKDVAWYTFFERQQMVPVAEGLRSFTVKYHEGNRYTPKPSTIKGNLEGGKPYLIKATARGFGSYGTVSFHIFELDENGKESKEVTLSGMGGSNLDALLEVTQRFRKYVLDPTLGKNARPVILESDDMIITLKPDRIFSLYDKKTAVTTEGRAGFLADGAISGDTLSLVECDPIQQTSDAFLQSDYEKDAQIVFRVIGCSEKEATLMYMRPASMPVTAVIFRIAEEPMK
jgi:hypothetical protein